MTISKDDLLKRKEEIATDYNKLVETFFKELEKQELTEIPWIYIKEKY